ncbi:MAG: 4Fe-4S binding protein [Candidatus Cloacimonadales bacterium]|nr:4Fe-4S binding protein [Candidatus Cloacimonadales bacterium]
MDKTKIRKLIQTVFIGFWMLLILLMITARVNTCHQFCPYAVVCFGVMTLNGFVAYLPMVIIGLLTAVSVIFLGRKFCGYICFLGTLQESIYKLNKSKNKFQQRIPYKYHRYLIGAKYLTFLITVIAAYLGIQYLYMNFCPVLAFAYPQRIGIAAAVSLTIIILGGFFVERFWCRYLCPYAAMMNIFEHLGKLLKIKRSKIFRNIKTSINCFNCANYCPLNIDIGYNEEISDANCIHCYRCVRVCSKKDASKSNCIYRD